MANILIACNNNSNVNLHDFMQLCADYAKQYCYNCNHTYTFIEPPHLTEKNISTHMENHHVCFIASHGDDYGIYNENGDDVVTTRTTNYTFSNKGFYSVACSCAKSLEAELIRVGAIFFVGYNKPFNVGYEEDAFCRCAMEGLKHILLGKTKAEARKAMLDKYDEVIKSLPFNDQIRMLRNKESLVFYGEDKVLLTDII